MMIPTRLFFLLLSIPPLTILSGISAFAASPKSTEAFILEYNSLSTSSLPDNAIILTQAITPANDGTGTVVTPEGNRFNIEGGTRSGDGSNLFHSFEKFGLDEGQIANFLSNPEIRNILGRVVGGDASFINGLIEMSGGNSNLFLINPSGILFGPDAQLNLPGDFTATTANGIQFGEEWFNADGLNNYETLIGNPTGFAFTMTDPGSVINLGTLAVERGNNLTLLGGTVINAGQLSAPEGQILVTAVPGENFVRISQDGQVLSLEIKPILASSSQPNNSSIPITALPDLLTLGVSGYEMAANINPDGSVELTVSDITIPVNYGTVITSGELDVSGETGGTVGIFGEKVGVIDSNINASGVNGGGTVLVGGEYKGQGEVPNALRTFLNQNSVINADSLLNGDGGRVIIWADEVTGFSGNINARGGSEFGNGGFVEVSGKEHLIFDGIVDVSAINGSPGTLLLDPQNITITTDQTANFADAALPQIMQEDFENIDITVSQGVLENQSGNVILQATENITVEDGLSLNFVAGGDITFLADADSDNVGNFQMDQSQSITTSGRSLTISGANITVGTIDTTGGEGGGITLNALGNGGIIDIRSLDNSSALLTNAGNIILTAGNDTATQGGSINITGEVNTSVNSEIGGIIEINALGNGSQIILQAPEGLSSLFTNGGNITLNAGNNTATQGGSINIIGEINTSGTSDIGGNVTLNALGNGGDITISETTEGLSSIFTNGGDITLNAGNDTATQGGSINIIGELNTFGTSEIGGNITLNALGNGSEIILQATEGLANLFTNGGDITLNAGNDTATQGGSINIIGELNASAINSDLGGNITLNALGNGSEITISETREGLSSLFTNGGNITLNAGNDTATQGGSINIIGEVNTFGTSEIGGNITLNALGNGSEITISETREGLSSLFTNGGNITLNAGNNTATQGGSINIIGEVNASGTSEVGGNVTLNALGNGSEIILATEGSANIETQEGDITLNAGNIDISNGIGREDQFTGNIVIESENNTQLNGNIFANSLTTDSLGTTELNANITTTNEQVYNDAVTLLNDVTLDSSSGNGNLEFNSTLNGNSNLQLNSGSGNILLGEVGNNTPLSSLTINSTGQTNLGGNITIDGVGGLNFENSPNIILTSDVIIDVSAGEGGINFGGGTVDGSFNLELLAGSGDITLGEVGNNTPLSSLTVNSTGQTNLGGNLTTSGPINLSEATNIDLISDITIDSSLGNGEINLNGGTIDGNFSLQLNAGNGNLILGTIGSETPLGNLTLNSSGNTQLNSSVNAENIITDVGGTTELNANITTTNNQIYNDAVTLLNSLTLDSSLGNGNLEFNSNLDGNFNLQLNAGEGNINLAEVGNQTQPLGDLTIGSATNINLAGNIFTNGNLDFSSAEIVNLLDSVTLETESGNGNVNLANVEGTGELTINAGSGQVDLASVGENTPLSGLSINTTGQTNLGGNITTSGTVNLSEATNIDLTSDVTIDSSLGNGEINLNGGTIDGNFSLQLNAGNGSIVLSTLGEDAALNTLSINTAGTTTLNGNLTTTENIDFTGATGGTQLNSDITVTSNNGNILFNGSPILGTNNSLTLNAGTGSISLDDVGSNGALRGLSLNATTINLFGNIFTSGGLNFLPETTVNLVGNAVLLDTQSDNGDINFSNVAVEGTGGLTLNAGSGNINLDTVGNTTPLAELQVNTTGQTNLGGNITTNGINGVSFSETSTVNLANDIIIDTSPGNGAIALNSTIDGNFNLQLNSGTGNITLGTIGSNTPVADLTINSSGNTQFNNTVNSQSLTTDAGGTTQLTGDVTTSGSLGQNYGDAVTLLNSITLTADEINFGDIVSGNNLDLTLQPLTFEQGILIGNSDNNNPTVLELTTTELNLLQNGFNSITIGSNNTGTITANGNLILSDPVTLRTGRGAIQATGANLSGTDNANVTLEAFGNIDVGDILNQNNSITLTTTNGSINTNNLAGETINLTTNGGDITLSFSQNASLSNPSISTAGGNVRLDSPRSISLTGSGIIQTTGGNITLEGSEISTQVDLDSSNPQGVGGNLNLTAQTGEVSTTSLNSSGFTGGNITVNAITAITTGEINSSGSVTDGGNVSLDPTGDVVVESINAQGGLNGRGGDVLIESTDRFVRVTGSFIDQNNVNASISTAGGQGGGSITIRHAGGPENPPVEVFEVGDALTENGNGTAAAITTGEFTINPPNSFAGSFTLGNISIETDDVILPFLNSISRDNLDNNISRDNEDETNRSSADFSGNILPRKEPIEPQAIAANLPCVPIDSGIIAVDQGYTKDFEEYWEISEGKSPKSLVETCDALGQVAGITGIKPAVIYANFVPVEYELETGETRLNVVEEGEKINSAVSSEPRESDQLELIVFTAEGQAIRKRISGVTRAKVMETVSKFITDIFPATQRGRKGYLPFSQQLYQWLISPIESELEAQDIQNLVFIVDEGLRSIPFAALHDGEQFLVEKYSVGLAPSLTLTETRFSDLKQAKVLAMGASQFPADPDLSNLPAVSAEVPTIIQNLWRGESFLNDEFTIENLKAQRAATPFGIVHLATHAEFRSGTPNNSYIQFWNQKLRLDEVRELSWNEPAVKLLVLSACQTALGSREAELGFAGFAAKAGVESVLASLWSVNDTATFALMMEFYQQLSQAPIKAEALRQAQIAFLRGDVRFENNRLILPNQELTLPPELPQPNLEQLSDPFFWAAFTLVGSPW